MKLGLSDSAGERIESVEMEPVTMLPGCPGAGSRAAKGEHFSPQPGPVSVIDPANVATQIVIADRFPVALVNGLNHPLIDWPDHDGTAKAIAVCPPVRKAFRNSPCNALG
jgi:hypothetical protein